MALSCLSVRASTWNSLAFTGWIFMKFEIWSFFCVEKIEVSLKFNELLVLYMKTNMHLWSYLTDFFLEWKMLQTFHRKLIHTHSVFFSLSFTNRAVYEIMWQDIVQSDRLQMTVWRMCIACWITKATYIHTEYVIFSAFIGNKGCINWSEWYIIHKLPFL